MPRQARPNTPDRPNKPMRFSKLFTYLWTSQSAALKTNDPDRKLKIKKILKEIGKKRPLENVQFQGERKF